MSWIAVGIGAAVGAGAGAIYGSQKGGDDVWKDALMGGALGAVGGVGVGALGAGAGAAGAGAAEAGAVGAGAGATEVAGSGLALGGAGLETGGAMGGAGILGGTEAGVGAAGAGGAGAGGAGLYAPGAISSGQLAGGAAGSSAFGAGAGAGGAGAAGAGTAGAGGAGAGGAGGGGLSGWWGGLNSLEKAGVMGAGTLGLGYLINQDNSKYGVPETETYSGPLSQFKYDPNKYKPTYATPNVYQAKYAEGGIAGLADGGEPAAPMQNAIYPQSQQEHTNFASSTQYPSSMKSAMASDYDARTNPQTGAELPLGMARGGIASLGGYSDGGQLLRGPGDGVSDSIPASIGQRQPARLADGEFVVPARAVSELGNGSTDAGAKQLYAMLDRIDSKRKKGKGLAYQAHPKKMMPV